MTPRALEVAREELYQVTLLYMCAGVIARDGYIVEAAAILRWAQGGSVERLRTWVERKGGTFVHVDHTDGG